MKRMLSIFLVLSMLAFPLLSLAEAGPALETLTTFPIVPEKITITGVARTSPQGGDHTDCYGWDQYEEMTNIHIEWEQVSTDAMNERKAVLFASGDLPDILYCMGVNESDLAKYGGQGMFANLTPYINEDIMPNFSKILAENPTLLNGLMMPDGSIYGLPYINLSMDHRIQKFYVNTDWITALGLDMPTTLDAYTDMLRAFRDNDMDGDGDATNEIPLSVRGPSLYQIFYSFFELGNRGTKHATIDWDETNDTMRFIPATDQYKDMLVYLNMLYSEGLLDNEVYTITSSSHIVPKLTAGIVGSHSDVTTNAGAVYQDKFVPIPLFSNAYGNKTWTRVGSMIDDRGAFVINAESKYIEEMLRWADHFYSEAGQLMYWLGFEDITCEYVDGEWRYTDEIIRNPEGLTLTQAQRKYLLFQWGPGIIGKYFKGAEHYWTSLEGTPYYEPFTPDVIWDAFVMTMEESEQYSALNTDIRSYVDEMSAAFVVGKKSFDEWDAYVAEFDKLGKDAYMALYQQLYQRAIGGGK